MATYLKGGVDYFPELQAFTPNYSFIAGALQTRESQYEQGFNALQKLGSIMNSQMLNETFKGRRDQYMKLAEDALKDLPNIDLSLSQNLSTAKSVFKPVYSDPDIASDIVKTKNYTSERQKGMMLGSSDKEEDRKRFWTYGIQYLDNWAEDYSKADAQSARGMNAPTYVGKPQVAEKVMDLFKDGKLKVSNDWLSPDGTIKYTDENGRLLKTPLTNLFLAYAVNDPEAMKGYQVYGSVTRRQYVKDAMASGKYATEKEAREAVDQSLYNDHIKILNTELTNTNTALSNLKTNVDAWESKIKAGNLIDPKEFEQAVRDKAEYESLLNRQKELNEKIGTPGAPGTAYKNIMSNPDGYMGQVYLYKSAQDLANALSQFGSRKMETSPMYKDLVQPFKLEEYKSQLKIQEDNNQSRNRRAELELKHELGMDDSDDGTGDGSGSSGTGNGKSNNKVTRKDLDQGVITSSNAASATYGKKDKNGQANAYQQNIDIKHEVIRRFSNEKLSFVETILAPSDFVNPTTGKVMTTSEKRDLLTPKGGETLDKLYTKALEQYNELLKINPPDKKEVLATAREIKMRADKLDAVWTAADKGMTETLKNIVGNFESSRPQDGWIFKYMVTKAGTLENNADNFVKSMQNDPEFKRKVDAYLKDHPIQTRSGTPIVTGGDMFMPAPMTSGITTRVKTPEEQRAEAVAKVSQEYKNNFEKYRNDVVTTWNKYGFSWFNNESPLKGGGGITGQTLTFIGSSDVKGEQADVLTEDFIRSISEFRGDNKNMIVAPGGNAAGGIPGNNEKLKELLFTSFGSELLTSIKSGKNANLKNYSISFSSVGGNNAEFNAYTIHFDPDFINKMRETKTKEGTISSEDAKTLVQDITIYVKKDKDRSLFSARSSMGEIDYLLNVQGGHMEDEPMPGYKVTLDQQARGNYTMTITGTQFDPNTKQFVPMSKTVNLNQGTDLTYYYYKTIRDLHTLFEINQTAQENLETEQKRKPEVKIFTMQDLNTTVDKMRVGQ